MDLISAKHVPQTILEAGVIMSEIIMPYGKFKGKPMHEISSGYLRWIAENFDDEKICVAADEEFQWREKFNEHF